MSVLGGTGVGYRVLWDEVPARTRAFDPQNKIILGVGPLTGTGAPSGGRTSITTIFPTVYPDELVATGHMGGAWGAELKYAAGITSSSKAGRRSPCTSPSSTAKSRSEMLRTSGGTASIMQPVRFARKWARHSGGCDRQAGENLVRLSVVMTGFSHSAGGVGGVFARSA